MPSRDNRLTLLLVITSAFLRAQNAPTPNAPTPAAPEKPASVEGSVVNSVTGEPLLRAHVTLRTFSNQGEKTYGAMTGPDGKFSVTSMAAGSYSLMAERVGFVTSSMNGSEQVRLSAGDAKTELKLKLIPCGAITGRVLDSEGEPVESAEVYAIKDGNFSVNATSDEKGLFRLGGLTPGKYLVRAKPQTTPFPPDIRSDGTTEVHYQRTYFPNVPTESAAAKIDVAAGAETGGIDIRLLRGPIVRVSGVVIGLPPGSENVSVTTTEGSGFNGGQAVKADGSFQIWRVDPGRYTLTARKFDNGPTTLQSAPVNIEVAESNVDNVELRMIPASDIQGQVIYEDEQAKPQPAQSKSQSAQANTPPPAAQLMAQGSEGMINPAKIADDGSFLMTRVQPDTYRIQPMWNGAYVKSMTLGQTQVDGSTLDLRNGPGGQTLTLRLSSAVAKVSGTVRRGNDPAPGVLVVIAQEGQGRLSFVRSTSSDTSGAYAFTVPPGAYKLVAIQTTSVSPFVRGRLSEEYDSQAEKVDLAASDQPTKDLKVQ